VALYTWQTPPAGSSLEVDLGYGAGEINDRGEGLDRQRDDGVFTGKLPFYRRDHDARRAAWLDALAGQPARVMGFEGRAVVDARPFDPTLLTPPGQFTPPGSREPIATTVLFPTIDPDVLAGLSGPPAAGRAERTLMITDPGVVRDPTRTSVWERGPLGDCQQVGDAWGPWGIAGLMQGLGGSYGTAHDMIMGWLQTYATTRTVNNQPIVTSMMGISALIEGNSGLPGGPVPWPKLVDDGNPTTFNDVMDLTQMPVQLTAIVNRPDLAAANYGAPGARAELRFVFTFIDEETCQAAPGGFILEYDTPTDDCASVQSWFQQWADLDALTPGSPAFNSALQDITDPVTAAGAAPGRPNDSMLKVLRVNEQNLRWPHYVNQFPTNFLSPWSMQQLAIDPTTHRFADDTLTQTPAWPYELVDYNDPAPRPEPIDEFITTFAPDILAGTYQIDLNDPFNADPFRAAVVLYGRFTWSTIAPPYNLSQGDPAQLGQMTRMISVGSAAIETGYVEARERLSLNTCNGCHYSETFEDGDAPGGFGDQNEGASTPGGALEEPFRHVQPDLSLTGPAHLSRFLTGTNADCTGAEFVAPLGPLAACTAPGCCPIGDPAFGYTKGQVHFNDLARRGQILQDVVTNGCSVLEGHTAADVIVSAAH
ncbi:MAG TPA: hypothetical protein PKA64_19735, partial [Myxococcota bacterium]|nr:hypothetical protein [Myxococcota bacterium]